MLEPIKSALRSAYFSKRLNPVAVKAYSRLRPPPYMRPRMEFDYDVWNGICAFHSDDGRQIGENNTNPEIYREIVETESKPCKFEGSRYGLPINLTALRNVMASWDDALQLVTTVRANYIARRGLDHSRFNLMEGYVLSKMGAAYVSYLVRRRGSTYAATPPLETVFFTLGVGPFMVVRALMEKGDLTPLDPEPMSGERLYELADSSGSLLSGLSGHGCAGSKKLITQFLDATMNGTYTKALNSTEVTRMLSAIDDWDRFYAYVYASSKLELLVKLAQCLSAQTLLALQADQAAALAPSEAELLARTLAGCYHRARTELDDRTVLANLLKVVLALLAEFDDPETQAALTQAGLLGPDGQARLGEISGTEGRAAAARRLRRITAVLQPRCQQELDLTNQSLDRFQGTKVSQDDLQVRSCGVAVRALLQSLEAEQGLDGRAARAAA